MTLVHNGNLTNHRALRSAMSQGAAMRHINSDSDSEALLNALAHLLAERCAGDGFPPTRRRRRLRNCTANAAAPTPWWR